MNNVAHRRQYPRYKTGFSTKYTVKEGKYRDLVRDIGAGGVYIRTRRKIDHGLPINIQLPIFAFAKRLSLMGTVVRCDAEGFAVMFNEAIEIKLLREGRFPRNVPGGNQSITTID